MKECSRCDHEKHLGQECGIILDPSKDVRCGCSQAKREAVQEMRQLSGMLFSIFGPPPPRLVQEIRNAEVAVENAIMRIPGRVREDPAVR